MNTELRQWLENPEKDYNDGVALLTKYAGKHIAEPFIGRSARFRMGKLVVAIEKAAKRIEVKENRAAVAVVKQDLNTEKLVDEAKSFIASLHTDIAKLTNEIFEVGENNDDESMNKRKELLEVRKPLIEKYNTLYELKEEYYLKKSLTKDEINVISNIIDGLKGVPAQEQVADILNIGTLTLAKAVKACKQFIVRLSNQLKYQRNTSAEVPNPMPDCPKREQLLLQLDAKKKEYAILSEELSKRK